MFFFIPIVGKFSVLCRERQTVRKEVDSDVHYSADAVESAHPQILGGAAVTMIDWLTLGQL